MLVICLMNFPFNRCKMVEKGFFLGNPFFKEFFLGRTMMNVLISQEFYRWGLWWIVTNGIFFGVDYDECIIIVWRITYDVRHLLCIHAQCAIPLFRLLYPPVVTRGLVSHQPSWGSHNSSWISYTKLVFSRQDR